MSVIGFRVDFIKYEQFIAILTKKARFVYKEKFQITYVKPRIDTETANFQDILMEHVHHRGIEAI